jgi:hypothetical protein
MIKILLLSVLSGVSQPACRPLPFEQRSFLQSFLLQDSCKQGIEGYVVSISGNQMPSPGIKRPLPKGVKTTVYVYELTNLSQAVRQDQSPYYSTIRTKMVKQADTDDTGYFKIGLPPGIYSLFTKKNGLFYASRFDAGNNIAPVEVTSGKMTRVECKVEGDRKPVY